MSLGIRQGVPIIKITIGDYLRDWEIEEKWQRVKVEMERLRVENVVVIKDVRKGGRFHSYSVESKPINNL